MTVLVGTGDGGAVTVLVGVGVTGEALAAGAARITDGLELLVSAPAAAAPPPSRWAVTGRYRTCRAICLRRSDLSC